MATVGTLLIDIAANTARLQQDMEQAKSTVDKAMAGIASAANLAKTALGALGVGASVAGLKSFVTGTAEAVAALKTLSDQTGVSVERLSAFRTVAKYADTDLASVATGIQKLSKTMYEAASSASSVPARIFQAMGVEVKTAEGQLRSADTVMQEVAKTMAAMADETQRVALAQQLFGKSGAQLLPFLLDLAKAGELNAKVTTEQAVAAKQFDDNLKRLATSSNAWKTALVNDLIPSLNTFLEQLLKLKSLSMDELLGRGGALTGKQYAEPLAAITEIDGKLKTLKETRDSLGRNAIYRFVNADDIAIVNQQISMLQKERAVLQQVASRDVAKLPALEEPPTTKNIVVPDVEKGNDNAWLREQERIRKLWVDGETAAAQAVIDEYEAGLRMQAEISEKFWANEERLRQEDVRGWVAHAEAVLKEAEDSDKAIAEIFDSQEKEWRKTFEALGKSVKDATDWSKDFGLTMASSLEEVILKAGSARSVIQALIQDIAKMVIRQTVTKPMANLVGTGIQALGNWATGTFGTTAPVTSSGWVSAEGGTGYATGMAGVAPRAGGGPISAGTPYLVGEQGPELIVPGASGTVVPNDALGGSVTINISTGVAQTVRAEVMRLLPAIQRSVEAGWAARRSQGGSYARA